MVKQSINNHKLSVGSGYVPGCKWNNEVVIVSISHIAFYPESYDKCVRGRSSGLSYS